MKLPDNLLLFKLKPQFAYCDKKSKEPATQKIRKKYKLLGNVLLDIYPFFILTTSKDSCHKHLTLEICHNDWEDREVNHLREDKSYTDISKVAPLNQDELLLKMKDTQNRFLQVAKLSDDKFNELKYLRHKIKTSRKYISVQTKRLLNDALEEAKVADGIVEKFKID